MEYYLFVVVCLIIHALINIDVFRRKPTVNLPAIRAYRVFVASIFIYFVSDLLWGIFDKFKLPMPLAVITTIYFIIMGFSILTWTRYVVKFLPSNKVVANIMMVVGNVFFLAEIVLLIVNIFTPVLFSIDLTTAEYKTYKGRDIMLYVQILMYFILLVYTAIFAFRSKGSNRRRYMTICLYSIAMGGAISAQIYFPYLPIYSIGCIVGSTLLNSFVISDIKEEYKAALEETRVEVNQKKEELSHTLVIAYTDPLTGIKNKHAYVEEEYRIDKLIAKGEMGEFAVVVFDLNGLKVINDTKGHDAGDVYIMDAVKTISRFFGSDHLYRFGGDEFVVILEGKDYETRHIKLSEFEKYIDACLSGTDLPIISSGMSRYRKESDNTYHAVFARADKIMYARKDTLKEHHFE